MEPAAALRRAASPGFWRSIRRWERFVEESERWPADRLAGYQLERLNHVVAHAVRHVPYYRGLLDRGELASLDDVRRLPLLEKRTVQERADELLADDVPESERFYFTTAGSSGTPVGFWHDSDEQYRERAFMRAQWRRVGYREGARSAVLRGNVVEGGLWRHDVVNGTLLMSSYHLTQDRLPAYVRRLRELRPKFVQAYPSSGAIVARHMLDAGEPPISGLRAVLCGSETLFPEQRTLIEQAFGARVYSWYGHSEALALGGECEHDTTIHLFPQYGYVELVDEEGAPVTERGATGEIVATSLYARAMPLIRYRTGDLAVLGAEACERCRRPYRLLDRIEGRVQEFVVTSTGRRISMTAINMHSPVLDNVFQFRFAQHRPGEVSLRIVPKPSYSSEADDAQIMRELMQKLGDDMALRLELVDEIPRGGRGKYRFLDQMLDLGS
jgi:phenylacetate-coenzyme A ligase PaaK-like adenylate-forming protein